jgi:type III pantothenate kinase
MRTICFDFGNTRLKAGIFEGESFIDEIILPDDSNVTISSILDRYNPGCTMLSSVINHRSELEAELAARGNFHKLDHRTKLNFSTPVGKPETIGADRLALIAAAVHFYPGKNMLIIGLGSCITYNFVNQYHEFLGGGISPGLTMRFRAMHEYTAKLPLVKEDWNFPLIGYDTRTNLQSGVIAGMASEIDGIIEKYAEKYGNFNAVLTGGNSGYFAAHLKSKIFADHNFLFKGLYALSQLNCLS